MYMMQIKYVGMQVFKLNRISTGGGGSGGINESRDIEKLMTNYLDVIMSHHVFVPSLTYF